VFLCILCFCTTWDIYLLSESCATFDHGRCPKKVLCLDWLRKNSSDSEKYTVYRTINFNIISLLCFTKGLDITTANKQCESPVNTEININLVTAHLGALLQGFFWLSWSCSLATEIVDTFNAMHVTGILAAKSLYVLSLYDPECRLELTTIKDIFPQETIIHVSQKCLLKVKYSEFVWMKIAFIILLVKK